MQADDKKIKHKDYEKNRRLKLNEELRANDVSNELLDACIPGQATEFSIPGIVHGGVSSGDDSREEAHADAGDDDEGEDLERGNKRTILRRTCEQLEQLTDTGVDREIPDIYRGPVDMEDFAMKNLGCSVLQIVVETGKILMALGCCETVFGFSNDCLVGRILWDFVPEDRRKDYEALVKAFGSATRPSDEEKFTTLITLKNCKTQRYYAMLMEGKFADDPREGLLFSCLLKEEPDDHLYEAADTYLSVSLNCLVVNVVDGFERVFHRNEAQMKNLEIRRLLQSSRGEAADLPIRFRIDQLLKGDVNADLNPSIELDDSFRVLDGMGALLEEEYKLVMKPIANPQNFDRFELIGIHLLLIRPERYNQHRVTNFRPTNGLHNAMSWSDS